MDPLDPTSDAASGHGRPRGPPAAVLVLLLLATPLLAGCASDPGPAEDPLGPDEYWLIWVAGTEVEEPEPEAVCDIAFDHSLDRDGQRLVYAGDRYDLAADPPRGLVAFDHFQEHADCPLAYHLNTTEETVVARMGHGGQLGIGLAQNGSALLDDGTWIEPGAQKSYTYEATYTDERGQVEVDGTFVVQNLGAWPVDGLEASGS